MTDEGLKGILSILEKNCSLTSLNLGKKYIIVGDNNITHDGATEIGRALKNNTKLTKLNLSIFENIS